MNERMKLICTEESNRSKKKFKVEIISLPIRLYNGLDLETVIRL